MEIKLKETKSKQTKESSIDEFISYLMVCRNVLHAMHLKVTGIGSYASHKALNTFYEDIGEFIDFLTEQHQGATGKLINCIEVPYKKLNTIEETISYLKEIKNCCTEIQKNISFSEIVNTIDELKSKINLTLYKLIFLK